MSTSVGDDFRSDAIAELLSARRQARRSLLAYLVRAREDERSRIASELHGGPLRSMTTVAARVEELRDLVGEELRVQVGAVERSVQEALARLRRATYDLSVGAAEEDLAGAVAARLRRAHEEVGVAHRLDERIVREPSKETRLVALRIFDEVLANVRQHAQAKNVHVTLEARDGIGFRVEDDGAGFDPGATESGPERMGLALMHQRAEAADGWLRVTSSRGKGTVVDFFVPDD